MAESEGVNMEEIKITDLPENEWEETGGTESEKTEKSSSVIDGTEEIMIVDEEEPEVETEEPSSQPESHSEPADAVKEDETEAQHPEEKVETEESLSEEAENPWKNLPEETEEENPAETETDTAGEPAENVPEETTPSVGGDTRQIGPVEDEDETPDIKTDVSVDELEKKITDSTVVSSHHLHEDYEDDGDYVNDEPVKPRKSPVRLTVFLLVLVAGIFTAVYLFMSFYFQDHFYSGTRINGTDVSGYTVEEVKEAIRKQVASYTMTISGMEGASAVLTAEDIDLSYKDDKQVDEIMSNQSSWKWFTSIAHSKIYSVPTGTTYDRDKAEEKIRSIDFLLEENMTAPENAYLAGTEAGASIVPEVEGNTVDVDKAVSTIMKAIDNGETSVDLMETDCYILPSVTADDEDLKKRADDWNAYLAVTLTYAFGDNKETIDKTDIASHLSDNGSEIVLDTDWVEEKVAQWADKYNTFGRERQFTTHSGKVVTLPAYTLHTGEKDPKTGEELEHTSDYGWLLNQEATTEDIINAIKEKLSGDREPVFKYSALGWDNGDLTGNYIEISLTDQHLWVYHEGQVVLETDVVTGLPVTDRKTYAGCFAIDAKKSPATLGTLATQGYSSDVEYWLPFDGGRGLHDAPWRTTFGGTEYVSNGSHGCVNCPAEAMAQIYQYAEIGMAVCVY